MYTIAVHSIRCRIDTDEFDSDEPYVLVFVGDATRPTGGSIFSAFPSTATTLYGPWGDVDPGESRKTVVLPFDVSFVVPRKPAWGIGGPVAIDSPDDLFVIVALVENDAASAKSVRSAMNSLLAGSFFGYVGQYWSGALSRQDMASRLIDDMRDALKDGILMTDVQVTPIVPGFGLLPEKDDLIDVRSFRIQDEHLSEARDDGERTLTRSFSGDGAKYDVTLGITHHANVASTGQPLSEEVDSASDHDARRLAGLPASLLARPAITSRGSRRLDVVARGMDRRFYLSSLSGTDWSGWTPIGDGTFQSGASAGETESRGVHSDRLFVVGRGDDRRVYGAEWDQGWSGWGVTADVGFLSAPALIGGAVPRIFALRGDRRVWWSSRDRAGAWSDPKPIGEDSFRLDPDAVIWRGGRVHVFASGTDGGIYQTWSRNGSWRSWRRIGDGTFLSGPAVAVPGDHELRLYALGEDRRVWECVGTDSGWSGWRPLDETSTLRSAPAAVSMRPDRVDVVAVGDDQRIYRNVRTGSRWSGWSADLPEGRFL